MQWSELLKIMVGPKVKPELVYGRKIVPCNILPIKYQDGGLFLGEH